MEARVLVAQADVSLTRIIERSLRMHGVDVVLVKTAADALTVCADRSIGLVLLDSTLADFDAKHTIDRVRNTRPDVSILLLASPVSATPATTLDPEDILTKPFPCEVLIARVRSRLEGTAAEPATVVRQGDLWLDTLARCAWRGERAIHLPSREFALLAHFMRHPGRILARADILAAVWGDQMTPDSNVVDVYVRYLHNHIDEPGQRSLVTAIRGLGNRFDPSSSSGGSVPRAHAS